jgi:hypothetical protein
MRYATNISCGVERICHSTYMITSVSSFLLVGVPRQLREDPELVVPGHGAVPDAGEVVHGAIQLAWCCYGLPHEKKAWKERQID